MKFGVVYKIENEKAKMLSAEVEAYLKEKGQEVLAESGYSKADFILSLGGDGTLIHKACEYAEFGVPLVGINVGRFGFLCAVEGKDWKDAVDRVIDGKSLISERMTLEARFEKSGPKSDNQFRAVNELVVKGLYRVAELEIELNCNRLLKVVGDGVILATQTGSTGYSLSAGGPIVDPDLDCMLLTPINPIGLPLPSVMLSPTDEVRIRVVRGEEVSLVIDGQEHTRINEGDVMLAKRGKYNIRFVYFELEQFAKALNTKFGLTNRSVGK